jgi:hypothetical protein
MDPQQPAAEHVAYVVLFPSQNLVFANATLGTMPPPDSWGPNHCMAAETPHTQWLKPAADAAADMAAAQAAGARLHPAYVCVELWSRSPAPERTHAHAPLCCVIRREAVAGIISPYCTCYCKGASIHRCR